MALLGPIETTHDGLVDMVPHIEKKDTSSYHIARTTPNDRRELKKFVYSNDLITIITWHIWTIVSCATTAVLLYLNFHQYAIGSEVGNSSQQTSNILSALQLASKVHEIFLVASIVQIGRQYIQRRLISDGTIRGLLAAESSLADLSLLFSREFRAAISCSFDMYWQRGTKDKAEQSAGRKLLFLTGFLSLLCVLCGLVGPASAVLMVPRYQWFREVYTEPSDAVPPYRAYPHIFIDPILSNDSAILREDLFESPTRYWSRMFGTKAAYLKEQKGYITDTHQYSETKIVTVNTTSLWNRSLLNDDWTGSTRFSSILIIDLLDKGIALRSYNVSSKNNGSESAFVADLTGLETSTVCRKRHKLPCGYGNVSEWCYMSVASQPTEATLQDGQDLLLIAGLHEDKNPPRLWMTEGERDATYKDFAKSIVVVLEGYTGGDNSIPPLVVCTISAEIKTVTATSSSQDFSPARAEYHDYLLQFDGKNTTKHPTQTLLYHEKWLDSIHQKRAKDSNASDIFEPTINYQNRSLLRATENTSLKQWAQYILSSESPSTTGDPSDNPSPFISDYFAQFNEAGVAEILIGGPFMSALLLMERSSSQYTGLGNFLDLSESDLELGGILPEPMLDYSMYKMPPATISHRLYGFRLSSRTAYFSAIILIIHTFIALLGSLFQMYQCGVITAWQSVHEYLTLAVGGNPSDISDTIMRLDETASMKEIVRVEPSNGYLKLRVRPNREMAQTGTMDEEQPVSRT